MKCHGQPGSGRGKLRAFQVVPANTRSGVTLLTLLMWLAAWPSVCKASAIPNRCYWPFVRNYRFGGVTVCDIPTLRRILRDSKVIAVVGLSARWYRPSFFAAKYLQEKDYRIIPVNPNYDEILGEKCYPDLSSIPEPVDVVNIFQRPEVVLPFVEEATRIGAKVVWMQLGVVNETAAKCARDAGLEVIMDRCMKIEHARLFGGLNFIGVNTGVISAHRPV